MSPPTQRGSRAQSGERLLRALIKLSRLNINAGQQLLMTRAQVILNQRVENYHYEFATIQL